MYLDALLEQVYISDKGIYVAIYNLRGMIAHKQQNNELAKEYLTKAKLLSDKPHEIYNNLAIVYKSLGDYEQALSLLIELENKQPNDQNVHNNLALVYEDIGDYEKAEYYYRKAPATALSLYNLGNFYAARRKLDEAILCYENSISKDASNINAQINLSQTLLMATRWQPGFALYEQRWKLEPYASVKKNYNRVKHWAGENLDNRSITLYMEQGYGDAIQFARYAKRLKQLFPECKIHFYSPSLNLSELLIEQNYIDSIDTDHIPNTDFYLSIVSLAHVLFNLVRDEPIIWSEPYISVGESVAIEGSPKIGICWRRSRCFG